MVSRRRTNRALASRDDAAFSVMIYAGLRIEETSDLAVEDLSFRRGEEEVGVAKGKGNKERLVPMGAERLRARHRRVAPARRRDPGPVDARPADGELSTVLEPFCVLETAILLRRQRRRRRPKARSLSSLRKPPTPSRRALGPCPRPPTPRRGAHRSRCGSARG